MADVKAYQLESKSVGFGQVLQHPYSYEKTRLVVQEMADQLSLDLVDKGLVTSQPVLTVGYDRENRHFQMFWPILFFLKIQQFSSGIRAFKPKRVGILHTIRMILDISVCVFAFIPFSFNGTR